LTSVPSGCGLFVGTITLPSGATMRLRPPRRWNRIGMLRSSEEVLPLPVPLDRERLQEPHEPGRRPAVEDPFYDVRGKEGEAQHAADIGAADAFGIRKIGERAEPALL
jgi:hypothetical protein